MKPISALERPSDKQERFDNEENITAVSLKMPDKVFPAIPETSKLNRFQNTTALRQAEELRRGVSFGVFNASKKRITPYSEIERYNVSEAAFAAGNAFTLKHSRIVRYACSECGERTSRRYTRHLNSLQKKDQSLELLEFPCSDNKGRRIRCNTGRVIPTDNGPVSLTCIGTLKLQTFRA